MLLKAESSTEILSLPCFTTRRDLKRASSSSSSLFDNTYNSDVTPCPPSFTFHYEYDGKRDVFAEVSPTKWGTPCY